MATKVKFIKAHFRHPLNEVATVTDEAANYYIRCKIAEPYQETEETAPKKTAPKKK